MRPTALGFRWLGDQGVLTGEAALVGTGVSGISEFQAPLARVGAGPGFSLTDGWTRFPSQSLRRKVLELVITQFHHREGPRHGQVDMVQAQGGKN